MYSKMVLNSFNKLTRPHVQQQPTALHYVGEASQTNYNRLRIHRLHLDTDLQRKPFRLCVPTASMNIPQPKFRNLFNYFKVT